MKSLPKLKATFANRRDKPRVPKSSKFCLPLYSPVKPNEDDLDLFLRKFNADRQDLIESIKQEIWKKKE